MCMCIEHGTCKVCQANDVHEYEADRAAVSIACECGLDIIVVGIVSVWVWLVMLSISSKAHFHSQNTVDNHTNEIDHQDNGTCVGV